MTVETPLVVREAASGPSLPSRPTAGGGRTSMIPGSSLHGALRSLHEALTGSCLRVLDDAFVPAYRQPATRDATAGLRMAMVRTPPGEHDAGQVELCEDRVDPVTHRIDEDQILSVAPGGLDSGALLEVTMGERGPVQVAPAPPYPREGVGGSRPWVVSITDAGTRVAGSKYRAAIRQLTGQYATIGADAWTQFLRAVEGADDLRPGARPSTGPDEAHSVNGNDQGDEVMAPVRSPHGAGRVVGRRYRAARSLRAGQPVWVRLDGRGEVSELRLAQLWRRVGSGSVGARAGEFAPCREPGALCPSCRTFGSADPVGDGDQAPDTARLGHRQRSYRGHVRVGDGLPMDAVVPVEVTLPPLGVPRPGAGQFYLANPGWAVGNAGTPPLREWGSDADRPRLRGLAGRKQYWRTSLPEGSELPVRGRAREHHQGGAMTRTVTAFPAGTVLRAAVRFSDLDDAALGGLLAALRPGDVLGDLPRGGPGDVGVGEPRLQLGGGRPLGYGVCRADVENVRVWRSAARYRAGNDGGVGEGERDDPAAVHRAAVQSFRAGLPPAVRATWTALAAVMGLDTVDPERVWYPPGRPWRERSVAPDAFDQGFEFFTQTRGAELKRVDGRRTGHPLRPLPRPGQGPQTLPIVTTVAAEVLDAPDPPKSRR